MFNYSEESVRKQIKYLEGVSFICAIVLILTAKWKIIMISVLCLGLLLQAPIYFQYKKLGESNKYLKNKLGAIIVGLALIIYIFITSVI